MIEAIVLLCWLMVVAGVGLLVLTDIMRHPLFPIRPHR